MSQADRRLITVLVILLCSLVRQSKQDAAADNCEVTHRSACPQSTFQTKAGDNWKCPSFWSTPQFSSTRIDDDLEPVDTSNLTAQVNHAVVNNKTETSVVFCSFTDINADSTDEWPSGNYCVPAPQNKDCPATMNTVTANITAVGRNFTCDEALPMFDCKNGSFRLNACCPKDTTPTTEYLDVPMYNIDVFYLLKTHATCPKVYSFSSAVESIVMDNATASDEHGQHFLNDTDGNLRISFCRYASVSCPTPIPTSPYEQFALADVCKRFATIHCGTGYKPQPADTAYGDNVKEFCYPNGTYHSNEFCGAECPSLPNISNGTLTPDSNSSLVTVTVRCSDGCYVEGNDTTTCSRGGVWSHNISDTACTFAQCKESDLDDGRYVGKNIVYTADGTANQFSYGHVVTYSFKSDRYTDPPQCYHFDNLLTETNVTCQQNGTWTPASQLANGTWTPVPSFSRGTRCPIPSNTPTATHTSNNTKPACTETVQYSCIQHRLPTEGPESLTLTCNVDGTWDRAPPTCNNAFCDAPNTNVTNGEVRYLGSLTLPDVFLANYTLHYDCQQNYRLVGDSVITCGDTGTWNGTVDSHCDLIVCPMAPLNIPHGYRIDALKNQTQYYLGDEVEYQCDSDLYELNYSDPISCNNTASWNPYIPSCDLVTCDAPPDVAHSIPPAGPHPLNSTFSYTCEKGYSLSNNLTLTCRYSNGTVGWTGQGPHKPTCDLVYCGSVPTISNGSFTTNINSSVTQYPYNTQFNYTCQEGFNASQAYYTNCSHDASWSPEPGCHAVFCPKPAIAYSLVNVSRSLYPYNTHVTVRCDDSRQYHPPQDLVCKENGKWRVVSGDEIISCHGSPVTEPVHSNGDKKWTFVGVSVAMFVVLMGLLLLYVIKKRRGSHRASHFDDTIHGYTRETDNELTGFSNPTYEENERGSGGRLVLKDSEGYSLTDPANRFSGLSTTTTDSARTDSSPQQYDTLHKMKKMEKLSSVSEPEDGQYNTLSQIKSRPLSALQKEEEEDEDGDIYNIPTNKASTLKSNEGAATNPYHFSPTRAAAPPSQSDSEEEEDIYNVPTLNRNQSPPIQIAESEVNVLYSSNAAAEICGTPIETDFDNIIYDNI